VQISPKTTVKYLVKMLQETGTKVSISTVKLILYRHNLKGYGRSHCSKTTIKKALQQNRSNRALTVNYSQNNKTFDFILNKIINATCRSHIS
jgi:hypothetical protein